MNEISGTGPALNILGTGSYINESLPDLSCLERTLYSFTQNSGVQFDNNAASGFVGNTYTIEAYFKFNSNTGFIRIIDYKNQTSDSGLYATSTELVFYNELNVNTTAFTANQYNYLVLTRDGNTDQVTMYLNGTQVGTFSDPTGQALPDSSNVINFFQDDLIFPGEAQPGSIALLNFYNYVLDSSAVADGYSSLADSVKTLTFAADVYSSCFPGNVFNFTNESMPSGLLAYSWYFGDGNSAMGSPVMHSYATPGNFDVYLVGDDGLGCVDTATAQIVVYAGPSVNLGPDYAVCPGDFALLDAGAGYASYLWSDGSTNQTLAVNVPGTYFVDVIDSAGCSGSDTILIVSAPVPVFSLGNDTTICFGTSLMLNAPLGNEFYLWSTGDVTSSISVTATGTYFVEVTTFDGCLGSDTINVTVNPQLIISLGNDTAICDGSILTLDPGAGYVSYQWNNSATTQTIDVVAAGQYVVTVTDSTGCTASSFINIAIIPAPVVDVGPDVTICGGTLLTIDAGPGFLSYLWSDGSTGQTLDVFTGGTYTVTVTDVTGCPGTDEIVVTADPFVSLGADVYLCSGDSVTLDPGPGYSSYSWSSGDTSQAVTAAAAGIYTVTVTDINGCINSDAVEVFIAPAPNPDLGPDLEICGSDTVLLDPGAGYVTYQWNTGSISPTISVSTVGIYIVTVSDTLGCTGTDTVVISPGVPPVVNLGPDFSFCSGTATILDAGSGQASYLWNDGSTSQLLLVISPGTYTVTVTNAAGCTASDTVNVGILNSPVVSLGPDTVLCDGDSILLDAGAGFTSYLWNDGSSSQTYYAAVQGTHTVTVTDVNGCSGTDDIQVDFYLPVPVPVIVQNGNTLQSSSATGNQWYSVPGGLISGAVNPTYDPPANGTYYVVVTDSNGCSSLPSANFNFVMSGIYVAGTLDFNVIPNPTTGILNINTPGNAEKTRTVEIIDLTGKVVLISEDNSGERIVLELSGLKSGIYLVKVTSGDSIGLKRIVLTN